jgi:nucleotide-binding universal stress UspA family protein
MEGDMSSSTGSESTGSQKKIVVGVDGSDASGDALRWALRQAELVGAKVDVIMTWEFPTSYGWVAPYPEGFDPAGETHRLLEKMVAPALAEHPGAEVETRVIEGHPAPVLIEAALDAQLLVVGSRGHGAFAGMLLGSVSEHCVSNSPCPVVVVRHPHHHD